MPKFYEASAIIQKLGFLATFLTNALFITLTLFYTKRIPGAYRKLLVIFASTCIVFSSLEIIVEPCIHVFNGGAVYFSLNRLSENDWLFKLQTFFLIVYGSCYVAQLAFIAIQFSFRYFTFTRHPFRRIFQGWHQLIWISYIFAIGALYGWLIYYFLQPDDFSDSYFEQEMSRIYGRDIRKTSRLMVVPYDNGKSRGNIIAYFCAEFVIMDSQYIIIIICAIKMQQAMKSQLSEMSTRNRNLERQFFKALSVQIILPTFFITIPVGSILILPLFEMKISLQGCIIFALYSLYPTADSIATMMIVSEYKCSWKAFLKDMSFGKVSARNQALESEINTTNLEIQKIFNN